VKYLDAEVTAVNVVSEKEIASLLWWSTEFKQLHEVIELSVDVTTHCNVVLHNKCSM